MTEGRGGGSGRDNSERWRLWRSAMRERERGRGEERIGGRVRGVRGVRGVARDHPERRGGGQAGREGGGGAAERARVGHAPIPLSRTKTTEEGPVGWAGAGCCWAAQGGGPGKYPFFITVFFSIFLTYVLI